MRYKRFNDGNLKRGVEGKYRYRDSTLEFTIWGTNSAADFFRNFAAWPRIEYTWCKVHRYWYMYALNLVEIVKDRVKQNTERILLRGHSMGGAVAQIAAKMLKSKYNITCVSIGAPMAGDQPFIDSISDFTTFIRHRGDIIPFLPGLGYGRPKVECEIGKWHLPWKAHAEFGPLKDGEK